MVDYEKQPPIFAPLLLYYDIHTVFVLMDDYDRHVLDQYGLNTAQYRTLLHIEEDVGERLTTISDRLLLSKSTITRVIDELEGRKWVQRMTDPEDRRAYRVILTEQGRKKREEIRAVHEHALTEIFQKFSPTDKKLFNELLQNLSSSLKHCLNGKNNHST